MLLWPPGTYGIAYDTRTRATEDDLPNGWDFRRGEYNLTLFSESIAAYTYYQLVWRLRANGSLRSQYSGYIIHGVTPGFTWNRMTNLFNINPPKLESTPHVLYA